MDLTPVSITDDNFALTPVSFMAKENQERCLFLTYQENLVGIARTFVEARQDNNIIVQYPGTLPANLVDAYAIQDDAIRMVGKPIGGWKVGRIASHLVDHYDVNRIAGPIFAHSIRYADKAALADMPILGGFAAVEAELMIRIGMTVPPQTDLLSIRNYIDEVRFGIEIASSPFPEINDHGPAVTVSDFGNNFGLLLGPEIDDWQTRDLMSAPATLALEEKIVGRGALADMLDGPFGAVVFLADLLSSRGIALTPGTWVSTGAITGVHRIQHGQSVRATFDNQFEVSCTTSPYSSTSHMNEGG